MRPKQTLALALQIREAGAINGFCYPYARLLLDKLIVLKKENGLFKDGALDENHLPRSGKNYGVATLTYAILNALSEQITGLEGVRAIMSIEEIDCVIEDAGKFLAIFED